mgnify:CR=1 FL=1
MLLDHVNLRCHDPETMARFLESLGIVHRGVRPTFDTAGFWLYDDSDRPVVHLSSTDAPADAPGVVDHIAFRTTDVDELKRTLATADIGYQEKDNRLAGVVQLKIPAPEGLVVEIQAPLPASRRAAPASLVDPLSPRTA